MSLQNCVRQCRCLNSKQPFARVEQEYLFVLKLKRVQQRLEQPLAAALEGTCADLGALSVVEDIDTQSSVRTVGRAWHAARSINFCINVEQLGF